MYDGTIPEVDVYMCFADVDAGSYYDAGPDWEMQTVESITVCNVEDYYRHGLPDYHTIKPTKPFCTQTHMGEYMLRDVHKSDCVTAEGVKLGTGDDNAASMNDIYTWTTATRTTPAPLVGLHRVLLVDQDLARPETE